MTPTFHNPATRCFYDWRDFGTGDYAESLERVGITKRIADVSIAVIG